MKGIFVGTVLLLAILALVISGVFFVVLSSEYINLKISLKASEILIASDVVEAVKIGLEKAYNYSFFQAAYDVGKAGGYENELLVVPWRRYSDKNFPDYIENLKKKTENYIREYLSNRELEKFEFSESNVEIKFSHDSEGNLRSVIMLVNFSQPFKYHGNFFTIYENPNRTLFLPSEYFEMYDYAFEKFVNKDSIREKIGEAVNGISSNCGEILIEICESEVSQTEIDPEEKLNEKCPNVDKNLENIAIDKIKELETKNVMLSIEKIVVKHEVEKEHDIVKDSTDCGCKIIDWSPVEATTCADFCESNGYEYSKVEDSQCYCGNCQEYYDKHIIKYEYNYLVAVNVRVNITTEGLYPVYDPLEGNTNLRKLALIFNVITSNDYNWNPI